MEIQLVIQKLPMLKIYSKKPKIITLNRLRRTWRDEVAGVAPAAQIPQRVTKKPKLGFQKMGEKCDKFGNGEWLE